MKKELMEPYDIDNIIKGKLKESRDLHSHEMDAAKPFIWSAIQKKIDKKRPLAWYHLAAAVILLLLTFSFIMYTAQKSHKNEISQLSVKIDQLQARYLSQQELLQTKNTEVESLGNELREVEFQLADLHNEEPLSIKETIVYRVDTIYLNQIKYITRASDQIQTKDINPEIKENQAGRVEVSRIEDEEMDDIIFPTYSSEQNSKQSSESIKLRFGSFAVRKN